MLDSSLSLLWRQLSDLLGGHPITLRDNAGGIAFRVYALDSLRLGFKQQREPQIGMFVALAQNRIDYLITSGAAVIERQKQDKQQQRSAMAFLPLIQQGGPLQHTVIDRLAGIVIDSGRDGDKLNTGEDADDEVPILEAWTVSTAIGAVTAKGIGVEAEEAGDSGDDLSTALLELAGLAEILPAFIVEIIADPKTAGNGCGDAATLPGPTAAEIIGMIRYLDSIPCQLIATAPLQLHNEDRTVVEAQLAVFRHFNKEHYALVIPAKQLREQEVVAEEEVERTEEAAGKGDKTRTARAMMNNFPLVRIHSSCFTGDLLRSLRCDCYAQLHSAIDAISRHPGGGILIYLNQEGRGIGLSNKVRAYQLQQSKKLDTVEANEAIGVAVDRRNFAVTRQILQQLGNTDEIVLLSNNPQKAIQLRQSGVRVVAVLPHVASDADQLRDYYRAKARKLNHDILDNVWKCR